MSRNSRTRLNELLAALCDGCISATEFDELEQLLASNEDHRQQYFKYMLLHGELNWDRGARQEELLGPSNPVDSATASSSGAAGPSPIGWKSLTYWRQHRWRFAAVALAATLLIWAGFLGWALPWWRADRGVGVAQVDPNPTSIPLVATVTGLHLPEWKEGANQWEWGAKLGAGRQFSLTSGMVELTFHDGVQVLLEGPCEFVLNTAEAGTLNQGNLVARVPPGAEGFTILTRVGAMVDLGTEFGAVVLEDGATQCVVLSGTVDVVRNGEGVGPDRVRLTENQGALIAADGRSIELRETADATLLATMRGRLMQIREAPSTRVAVTGDNSANAALIGHWKFDEGSGNIASDASPQGNDAKRTGEGSWIRGKSGGAYDRPQFHLIDSSDYHITGAVTVAAWVKPNAPNRFSVVAGIEQFGGDDDMYALKTNRANKIDWYLAGVNEPVTSTDTLTNYSNASADGWVHLVGVFQPEVASALYVNGVLNASAPGHASNPLNRVDFSIGVYPDGRGPFSGAVDDVQVYRGALSAKDVRCLFNNPGSPIETK